MTTRKPRATVGLFRGSISIQVFTLSVMVSSGQLQEHNHNFVNDGLALGGNLPYTITGGWNPHDRFGWVDDKIKETGAIARVNEKE